MDSVINERKVCPICKGIKLINLYKVSFGSESIKNFLNVYYKVNSIDFSFLYQYDFIISKCVSCNFVFQKGILNDKYLQKFYDWLTLPDETKSIQNFSYYKSLRKEIENIIKYLKKTNKLCFLDFGMGWGEWGLMAQAYGHNVYGIELSEEKRKFAEVHGIKVINWNDIQHYKFDFVNTEQVFEHISEPLETLQYLKKSLNNNGIIKVSIPNGENIEKYINNPNWIGQRLTSLMPIAPLEHINCFQQRSMATMAKLSNLEIIKIPQSETFLEQPLINILRPIYRVLKKRNPIKCYYLKKI